jgi:cholesterol transport system auxiliary component
MRSWPTIASIIFVANVTGCALTEKGDVLAIRWFDPETSAPRITSASTAQPARGSPMPVLELGRVTSGPHLRQRIAYRSGAFEVGYYDDKRWTERPETYVRRAIGSVLFEERSLRRAEDGSAPVLDVEVLSFEEVTGPQRRAQVRLRMILRDENRALMERTLTVERPVMSAGIEGLVQAMAGALDEAAHDVASLTEATLRSQDRGP